MTSSSNLPDGMTLQLFQYYDEQGNSLGESKGHNPDPSLYSKAHYVVSNQARMLKNKDTRDAIKRDIDSFKDELVNVSVSNMTEIMQINRTIRALSDYLDSQPIPY